MGCSDCCELDTHKLGGTVACLPPRLGSFGRRFAEEVVGRASCNITMTKEQEIAVMCATLVLLYPLFS